MEVPGTQAVVIDNALSVLAVFAALLRVAIGVFVLVLGVRALGRRPAPEQRDAREARYYLLFASALTLLGLAIVSWPLLYMVLQSYVPQWPGVMCIQGVTQVGLGSVGPASYLPGLLAFLEAAKPALVFAAGAWLMLHLANLRSRTGVLGNRALWALLAFGVVATLEGAGELAYLFIPKQETFLAAGCCTIAADPVASAGGVSTLPLARADVGGAGLTFAFFAVGCAVLLTTTMALWRASHKAGGRWLALSLLATLVSVPVGSAFLSEVGAPSFLGLPYHQCTYCLMATAPEGLVGILLYAAGAFAVGWACAARWLGRDAGRELASPLLQVALFGYSAALLMTAVKLATL